MPEDELSRDTEAILSKYKTVAVVGLSRDPSKDSHAVASYLNYHGYEIIPVNPFCEEVLDKRCYPSLLEIPEETAKRIEIVDIFRPPSDVPTIVDQAIKLREKYSKPEVIWMQLGITNEGAAKAAKDAGMSVVMNRCTKIEHLRMNSSGD